MLFQKKLVHPMKNSMSQEFYKFKHLRLPVAGLLFIVVAMIYTVNQGAITKTIAQEFGGSQWVIITMIMVTAQLFGIEFRNGTLPTVVFKSTKNKNVLISKLLLATMYLLTAIFSMTVAFIVILGCYQRFDLLNWQLLFTTIFSTVVYGLFIIGLISLLTILFRSSAIAGLIGLVLVFLGAPINDMLFNAFPGFQSILKWNPLNMIYVSTQLVNGKLIEASQLANAELVFANLVYILIFVWIDYLLVRKNFWLSKG